MESTPRIVTFPESKNVTHYHLLGCGLLRPLPLTEGQARFARQFDVPIDLPDTAPLSATAVSRRREEAGENAGQ